MEMLLLFFHVIYSHSFPTEERDYIDHTVTLTFQPGEVQMLVDVAITDDDVLEGQEMFTATLTTEDSNVNTPSDSDTVTVIIKEHDCKFLRK